MGEEMTGQLDKTLKGLIDAVLRADAATDSANDEEYARTVGQAVGRLRSHLEATGEWSFEGGWVEHEAGADAREALAWRLRYRDRLKWRDIGERLGVCYERARQLAAAHERRLRRRERGGRSGTGPDDQTAR